MTRLTLTDKDAELIAEALENAISDSYTDNEIFCKAPRMNKLRNKILEAASSRPDTDAGRRERESRGFDEYIKTDTKPEPEKTESLWERMEKISAIVQEAARAEKNENAQIAWNKLASDLETAARFIAEAAEAKNNIVVLRGFLDAPNPTIPLSTEPEFKYLFPDLEELPF